jgi:hypothetical protein
LLSDAVELTLNVPECPGPAFSPVAEAGFARHDPALAAEEGNITVGAFLQLKCRAWAERWVEEHGVSFGIHVCRGDYYTDAPMTRSSWRCCRARSTSSAAFCSCCSATARSASSSSPRPRLGAGPA